MDIKEAAHSEAAAQRSAETAATIPRRIIAAGLSGAAFSLLPWLGSRASAKPATVPPASGDSTPDTTSDSTAETTAGSLEGVAPAAPMTTVASPKRPTPADIELLGFCQSVELAIVKLYRKALDEQVFEGTVAETFNTIRQSHLAYAQSLSGLMGREAPNVPNEALYTELEKYFTGSATEVAAAAAGVENTAVATHTEIVGLLQGLDGATLVASFLVIEARHATVFRTFAGTTSIEEILADEANALTPADYPVE